MLTLPSGTDCTGTDKTEEILGNTKKEEVEVLSSTKNNKKAVMQDHFDAEEIIFRKDIEHFLEQSVDKNFFNLGKIKDYHIFTEGVSSVVARIDMTNGKKYVFKSGNDFVEGGNERMHIEGDIYDVRRKIGIKTPIVYKKGIISQKNSNIPYILMEYIQPEKKLVKNMMETSMLQELGENIAKMNTIHGEGFGRIKKIEGNIFIGVDNDINELYTACNKNIKILGKRETIGEYENQKTQKAIHILKNNFISGTEATVTHDDIRDNFFLTKPMTIFDPNPRLDHPLNDIASISTDILLDNDIIQEKKEGILQNIYHGYEKQNGGKIDKNILNACIIVKLIQKIRWMSGSQKKEKKIQEALSLFKKTELI